MVPAVFFKLSLYFFWVFFCLYIDFCRIFSVPSFAFFLPLKTLSVFSRPNFDIFVPLNALDIFLLFYIWCICVISAGSCQEQDAAMGKKEGGWRDSNPRPPGPQPSALTNWATPTTILFFLFIGTPGGIRTPGLRIRSPLLYPAELQAHTAWIHIIAVVFCPYLNCCRILRLVPFYRPWFYNIMNDN